MNLLYAVLVLLLVSRIFAELAERLGQAPLVGELIAGVGLGVVAHQFADFLPIISELTDNEVFAGVTDLAIFFLMMLAGMELRPREMAEAGTRATLIATGGMIVPVAAGLLLAVIYFPRSDLWLAQALFLAVALAITAVPVAVRVLMDLKVLDTVMGRTIVSAAVVDDAASLILLAVLTSVIEQGALPGMAGLLLIAGKVLLFFALTILIGKYLFPYVGKLRQRLKIEESDLSSLLIVALAYAFLAELLGVHFILGAFMAGLFFGRRTVLEKQHEEVHARVKGITTGFFAPIFFTSIGLHLSGAALVETPVFVLVLILVALSSKLVGAGVAARLTGMDRRTSLAVGTAMSSRGAVELIIAEIALRAGLFTAPEPPPPIIENMFSAIVIMAISTTVLAPVVLRHLLKPWHLEQEGAN
jgi:Kef-type K+ transport system membrane component KefB